MRVLKAREILDTIIVPRQSTLGDLGDSVVEEDQDSVQLKEQAPIDDDPPADISDDQVLAGSDVSDLEDDYSDSDDDDDDLDRDGPPRCSMCLITADEAKLVDYAKCGHWACTRCSRTDCPRCLMLAL